MNQKQIGFTASKKIGNAVKRNFAKRRLRALFAEFSESLTDGTYVFVAKKDILDIEFSKLQNDLSHALKRVGALQNVQKTSS
jgi:ribonuclease P protein component